MATTIIGLESGSDFEPEIQSVTMKDGITAFSFNVIGKYNDLSTQYLIDSPVINVPNGPRGNFKVTNRNLQHISGGVQGIYRLSVSAEGGTENQSQITETSYSYAVQDEGGILNITTGVGGQLPIQYRLEWLYPSGTVITNSQSASSSKAEALAKGLVGGLSVQVILDRPLNVTNGKKIDQEKVIITGTSVEQAGGLYRIRATASKGASPTF